jgi:hypothetical protein
MDNGFDLPSAIFMTIFTIAAALLILWHVVEADCQRYNNVSDCEWSTNPFNPVIKEDKS